jgi:hypothetical protein
MAVSYIGASTVVATNGTQPGAVTPHASTTTDDLVIFFHFNRLMGGPGRSVAAPTGFSTAINDVSQTHGILAVFWKIREAGDSTYQATTTGHLTGNSGESILHWCETWRGTDLTNPIKSIASAASTWASSLNIGAIAAPPDPSSDFAEYVCVFGGRSENITAQTTLTGNGHTWNQNTRADTTLGADAGAVTQRGVSDGGGTQTLTAKTITTTGTAQVGKGVMFTIQAPAAGTPVAGSDSAAASEGTPVIYLSGPVEVVSQSEPGPEIVGTASSELSHVVTELAGPIGVAVPLDAFVVSEPAPSIQEQVGKTAMDTFLLGGAVAGWNTVWSDSFTSDTEADYTHDRGDAAMWAINTTGGYIHATSPHGSLALTRPSLTAAPKQRCTVEFEWTSGGGAFGGANLGPIIKRVGAAKLLYLDATSGFANGTPSLRVVRYDPNGQGWTVLKTLLYAEKNYDQRYWGRIGIDGNVITVEFFTNDPFTGGTATHTDSYTLTGQDATDFGSAVSGAGGQFFLSNGGSGDASSHRIHRTVFEEYSAGGGQEIAGPIALSGPNDPVTQADVSALAAQASASDAATHTDINPGLALSGPSDASAVAEAVSISETLSLSGVDSSVVGEAVGSLVLAGPSDPGTHTEGGPGLALSGPQDGLTFVDAVAALIETLSVSASDALVQGEDGPSLSAVIVGTDAAALGELGSLSGDMNVSGSDTFGLSESGLLATAVNAADLLTAADQSETLANLTGTEGFTVAELAVAAVALASADAAALSELGVAVATEAKEAFDAFVLSEQADLLVGLPPPPIDLATSAAIVLWAARATLALYSSSPEVVQKASVAVVAARMSGVTVTPKFTRATINLYSSEAEIG